MAFCVDSRGRGGQLYWEGTRRAWTRALSPGCAVGRQAWPFQLGIGPPRWFPTHTAFRSLRRRTVGPPSPGASVRIDS